jgi:TRAP-type C4-dicarboxylate transport system substrate-binding protein
MTRRRSYHPFQAVAIVLAACIWVLVAPVKAQQAKVLKISHQFPGGSIDEGDFRDRLVRKFAQEVEKRTGGQLKFEIYPASSLIKPVEQWGAMTSGSLDLSLYPLSYAGGRVPEFNIGLMPALISSYEQGLRWKEAPIGKELNRLVEEKGAKILTWVWQAGGIASKDRPIISPDDVKGLKFRGGSKEMDMMLKAAGASVTNLPSSEIYSAMQSGVLDAALTSSTSLISFRLHENAKHVTTAREKTFWFMFEPLMMSKASFDKLTPEQQKIVLEVGASLEKFGLEAARADDQKLAEVYTKAGDAVHNMNEAAFDKWREIAKASAWKDFEEKVRNGKQLLDMAVAVK